MNGATNNNAYLYAAYIVVWVIHCVYAFSLMSRGKRMKRETRELNQGGSKVVAFAPRSRN
jgi:CcmD family protein